jgi:hypothetical protein
MAPGNFRTESIHLLTTYWLPIVGPEPKNGRGGSQKIFHLEGNNGFIDVPAEIMSSIMFRHTRSCVMATV